MSLREKLTISTQSSSGDSIQARGLVSGIEELKTFLAANPHLFVRGEILAAARNDAIQTLLNKGIDPNVDLVARLDLETQLHERYLKEFGLPIED